MKPSKNDLKRARTTEPNQRSWADLAREAIAKVDKSLAPETPLKVRMAAVDKAYPFVKRCHYPYQVWCKVRRKYLAKYGYVPQKTSSSAPLLKMMEEKRREPE